MKTWDKTKLSGQFFGHLFLNRKWRSHFYVERWYQLVLIKFRNWGCVIDQLVLNFFFFFNWSVVLGLPWWLRRSSVCLQCGRPRFNPWVGKIPWRRKWQPTPVKWQPTPVLLLRKPHGWRSLVGYSLCIRKESETTERLHFDLQCCAGFWNTAKWSSYECVYTHIYSFRYTYGFFSIMVYHTMLNMAPCAVR